MDVRIIDEAGKNGWNAFIEENPHAIAWQLYDWSELLKKHYSFDFYPIAAFDGDNIYGVLPLYHMKTFSSKDILISVPYAVAGGIVADDPAVKKILLEKAIELSHKYNDCKVILKQYKIRADDALRTDDNFYNRELNISRTIDEIWNEVADENKKKIEISERFGLEIEYPFHDIDEFYKMLLRHSHTMGVPCVSKKWITSLVESQMYTIAVIRLNGEIVAGTMLKSFKKTVSFPFTCIKEVDNPENEIFAFHLYWNLIKQFSENGYEIFHSGRIANNNITNAYRLGWGGTKYEYFYQYFPGDIVKTEHSVKRGKKREIFGSVWKMLPRAAVGVLGPRIVRHFP